MMQKKTVILALVFVWCAAGIGKISAGLSLSVQVGDADKDRDEALIPFDPALLEDDTVRYVLAGAGGTAILMAGWISYSRECKRKERERKRLGIDEPVERTIAGFISHLFPSFENVAWGVGITAVGVAAVGAPLARKIDRIDRGIRVLEATE